MKMNLTILKRITNDLRLILLIVLFSPLISSFGQRIENMGIMEGLSSHQAYKIVQGKNGFIWVATKVGIDRFDGENIVNYSLDKRLVNTQQKIYVATDSELNIWAYTPYGYVFEFDEGQNSFVLRINLKDLLKQNVNIVSLFIDSHFWFCTSAGLYYLDSMNSKISKIQNFERSGVIRIIHYLKDDYLVALPNSLVVINLKGGIKDTLMTWQAKPDQNWVRSIMYDPKLREVWIGTRSGDAFIYNFQNQSIVNLKRYISGIPSVPINKIVMDGKEFVYLGSDGGGVFKLSRQTKKLIENFREDENIEGSLVGNGVQDLFISAAGDLYISTFTGGLNILRKDEEQFKIIRHELNNPNSLGNNVVNAILEDKNGNMWFATNNGVSCLDKVTNRWKHFLDSRNGKTAVFLSLFEDVSGEIMAGSYSQGIYVIDKDKGIINHIWPGRNNLSNSDTADYVVSIFRDHEGKLWTGGTFKDLAVYYPKTRTYKYLPITGVNSIISNDSVNLFIGTPGGLYIMNSKNLNYYREDFSGKFPVNTFINSLTLSADHSVLWIATSGSGIIRWNLENDRTEKIDQKTGLPSDNIYAILIQGEDRIWASSESGLICYNQKEKSTETFTVKDGLSDNAFYKNSKCATKSGDFYFGSYQGLTWFKPTEVLFHEDKGSLYLEQLLIRNKRVFVSEKKSPLKQALNSTRTLILSHAQQFFSINFTFISETDEKGIEYSWKLDGLDKNWSLPADDKTANYTNVPKGEYTFRLRALGSHSENIIDERALHIIVKPAWWDTIFARLIATLIIIAIAYWIMKYIRLSDMKKLSEARIQFFTNTAHDIRTPLTLVGAPLSDLQRSKYLTEHDRYLVDLSVDNLSRITDTVNHLLDFQKADMGKSQLVLSSTDLVKLIREKLAYFIQITEARNIELLFHSTQDEIIELIDVAKFDKILDNLLSNSIKYTPDSGSVEVILSANNAQWKLIVKDNGIGIPNADQKDLFKRYYRAENAINSKTSGTGIGLLLIQNYVSLHKGKIEFKSSEGKGTEFSLTFLQRKSHFDGNAEYEERHLKIPGTKKVPRENLSGNKNVIKQSTEHKLSLLFVEDNDNLRDFLGDSLSANYRVETAENGRLAWEKIKKSHPDIIISDVRMPEMDGIELTRLVKDQFETSHIPVILLTAFSEKEDIINGLQIGADDYVAKPFDTGILIARIQGILKNRQKIRDRFVSFVKGEDEKGVFTNKRDQEFIDQALAVVEANIMNTEFSKEVFAREMFVSSTLLYQKIKTLTGQSPSEFVKIIRLKHAAGLLKENQYNINEIATLSGFSDPKYFSTSFRKFFGESPTYFLKNHRNLP